MEALPKLTPTQGLLLRTAARRADGRVISPDNLRGGARAKAMTGLMRREWIEAGDGSYVVTDAGYAVAGRRRPAPPEAEGIPVRPRTKLAALVVALRRPQGATSLQLMLATGWQPHSVRYATRVDARADVFDHIERFYNPRRRHAVVDGVSPVQFEETVVAA